jgi:nucleotide-binding universal stress UspA family protein
MFEKILVALDESDHAGPVLAAASEFATKFGAEVHVLHVLETAFVGKAGSVDLESPSEKHKLVDDAVATLMAQGIKATGAVRASVHGAVATQIKDEATLVGASAIVTGSHGLGEIRGLLVGSTTYKLLHIAHLPVLVIP